MISLLLSAIIASAPPMTVPPQDQRMVDRCRAHFGSKIGVDGSFAVTGISRHGRTTTIRGTLSRMEKAPPAEPGMMRPNHVLKAGYDFKCEMRSGRVVRASLSNQ